MRVALLGHSKKERIIRRGMILKASNLSSKYTKSAGQPVLNIKAENESEQKQLNDLLESLHEVHLIGIESGKSGIHNPCGSNGDLHGHTFSLTFWLDIP